MGEVSGEGVLCGAFRTDSARARCTLESDHKEAHVWDDDAQAKGCTLTTLEEMKAAIEVSLSQRGVRVGLWGSEDSIRGMYSKLLAKTALDLTIESLKRDATTSWSAPESEDEAFERAWSRETDSDFRADGELKRFARKWWNARAWLDAERGR